MKRIKSVRGESIGVPPILSPLIKYLRDSARVCRAQAKTELVLGKQLAPILRRLERSKDKATLLSVGNLLNEAGSWNARFFFEAAYRLKK